MRVTTVQRARKDAGRCGKCGDAIPVGQPYRWTAAFRGPRKVRCMKVDCSFAPSELESNDKLARLYEIREEMERYEYQADAERAATLRETLDDWAERASEVAEEYEESAQAIEDGFGHETEQSAQMTEDGDSAREWTDEIKSAVDEVPDWTDDGDEGDWDEQTRELLDRLIGALTL